MNKISVIFFVLICSKFLVIQPFLKSLINGFSLEHCLKKHQKAFKKFEIEVDKMKVDRQNSNGSVEGRFVEFETIIYRNITPNFEKYMESKKILRACLFRRTISKTFLSGLLTTLATVVLFLRKRDYFEDRITRIMVFSILFDLLVSIGIVSYENLTMPAKSVPYFDKYLYRQKNFFSSNNIDTVARIFAGVFIACATNAIIFFILPENLKKRLIGL